MGYFLHSSKRVGTMKFRRIDSLDIEFLTNIKVLNLLIRPGCQKTLCAQCSLRHVRFKGVSG